MIEFKNVSYSYNSDFDTVDALYNVSINIKRGKITAIIGHTGSGKSTFLELASGIAKPTSGRITIDKSDISKYKSQIGIVFQYPEYQLFADTVYDDIAFAPSNMGIKGDELRKRVMTAAKLTNLSENILKRSPFNLSGGQKRLAAIAGILAAEPEILFLDEPSAGLDPYGKQLVFDIMHKLISDNPDMIIVFVTHSMEDAAEIADEIIILDHGCIAASGTPKEVFKQTDIITSCGLDVPEIAKLGNELLKSNISIGEAITVDEAFNAIKTLIDAERNKYND